MDLILIWLLETPCGLNDQISPADVFQLEAGRQMLINLSTFAPRILFKILASQKFISSSMVNFFYIKTQQVKDNAGLMALSHTNCIQNWTSKASKYTYMYFSILDF